jgi:hypothetical protein
LEHRQAGGDLGQVGNDLDTRRARADHPDPLGGEVDRLSWPLPGVVPPAGEVAEPGDWRDVGGGEESGGHDHETGGHALADGGDDGPAAGGVVEGDGGDRGIEGDVRAQVEPVGDVVDVAEHLGLGRELLAPLPLLFEFGGERVRVVEARDVAAGARVAVPVPRAAYTIARFEDPGRQAELLQPVEHVQPRQPGADHHGVDHHAGVIDWGAGVVVGVRSTLRRFAHLAFSPCGVAPRRVSSPGAPAASDRL